MGWTKGVGCHYKYKVSLDVEALMEYLAKEIGLNGECKDYHQTDNENDVFEFEDYIPVNIWSSPATRWEPAEWEMEAPDWVDFSREELNRAITRALRKIPDGVIRSDFDCELDDYELDEPDY